MRQTNIIENGSVTISIQNITQSSEVAVYVPASIGAATVTIGWIDEDDTVNPYEDGGMLAGQSKRFACGRGVKLVATVSGFSTAFKIGYAD